MRRWPPGPISSVFVQFPKSPRHVDLAQARALSQRAAGKAVRVALAVDPDNAALEAILAAIDPEILQLHGHETPQRVGEIRRRFGVGVMKAIGIADAADLAQIGAYQACCDRILVDAKPPAMPEALPGGNGLTFDWQLIAGLDDKAGLMLSGGLNPANVGDAIALTGVDAVDVFLGRGKRARREGPATHCTIHRGRPRGLPAARGAVGEREGEIGVNAPQNPQFLPQRPGRDRAFRSFRRPFRRRDADAQHPRTAGGL